MIQKYKPGLWSNQFQSLRIRRKAVLNFSTGLRTADRAERQTIWSSKNFSEKYLFLLALAPVSSAKCVIFLWRNLKSAFQSAKIIFR